MASMKPSIPFHGSQKYLEVHASQVFIVQTIFLITDDMNISDTKMVTKKDSRLCTNVFIFGIYNIG
jgi:hypothetical protein